jgi:hypothetical protein
MTCYNSEMKSVQEVLKEMQEPKERLKQLKVDILSEINSLSDKEKGEIATKINRAEKEIKIGKYNLLHVNHGVNPLDSNIYEYVYVLDSGDKMHWSAQYTSYDNGGPDGDIDSWSLEYFTFVELKPVVVNDWVSVE